VPAHQPPCFVQVAACGYLVGLHRRDFAADVNCNDIGPIGCHVDCDCATDSPRGSGYHRNLAGKQFVAERLSRPYLIVCRVLLRHGFVGQGQPADGRASDGEHLATRDFIPVLQIPHPEASCATKPPQFGGTQGISAISLERRAGAETQ
jgi:hypothetical protein